MPTFFIHFLQLFETISNFIYVLLPYYDFTNFVFMDPKKSANKSDKSLFIEKLLNINDESIHEYIGHFLQNLQIRTKVKR